MLIREIQNKLSPSLIKLVGEIYLSKHKPSLCTSLSNLTLKSGFKDLEEFLVKNGVSNSRVILEEVRDYLLKRGVREVFLDYCRTPRMKNILRNIASNSLAIPKRSLRIDEIINLFGEFLIANSQEGFDLEVGGIIQSFRFFLLSYKDKIYNMTNERGMLTSNELGDSLALDKLLAVDIDNESIVVDFDFKTDIMNIYNASKLLYSSQKRGNSSNLYSNLVTEYRFYKNRKFLSSSNFVKNICNLYFPSSVSNKIKSLSQGIWFPSLVIEVPSWSRDSEYRKNSYNLRVLITNEVFNLMGNKLTVNQIEQLYSSVMGLDFNHINDHNTSIVWSHDPNMEKEDREKFIILLKGKNSLEKLINYCEKRGIDLESISTNLYSTDKYYKRFETLEDYMECARITELLIKEEAENSSNMLFTNQQLYNYLKSNSSLNFNSIKELITQGEQKSKPSKETIANVLAKRCRTALDKSWNFVTKSNQIIYSKFKGFENADLSYLDYGEFADYEKLRIDLGFEDLPKLIDGAFTKIGELDYLDYYSQIDNFTQLYSFVLSHLVSGLTHLVEDEYQKIIDLGSKKLTPLPLAIYSVEDLAEIRNNILKYSDGSLVSLELNVDKYDNYELQKINYMYQVILKNLKKVEILYFNSEIDSLISEFANLGIETIYQFRVNSKLADASDIIFETKSCVTDIPKFNVFKLKCQRPNGYLYMSNRPIKIGDNFIHEYGYLVSPLGTIVRRIDESDF